MTEEILVKEIAAVIAHHHPDYTNDEVAADIIKRVRRATVGPSRVAWEAREYCADLDRLGRVVGDKRPRDEEWAVR